MCNSMPTGWRGCGAIDAKLVTVLRAMEDSKDKKLVTLSGNLIDHDVRQTRDRPLSRSFIPADTPHVREGLEMLDAVEQAFNDKSGRC